jgi:F-type H+-transporting ATPase subunit b
LTLKIARDSLISFENQALFASLIHCYWFDNLMFVLAFAESIQLFPDGTLFIHVGLILLMIWVLNRTFFRPINRVVEQREIHKGGAGGEAATILKEAGEKEARVTAELLEARSQGYELIEKELKQATDARQEKLAAAKAETAALYESGRADIDDAAAETRAAIETDAQKIADQIAATILKA